MASQTTATTCYNCNFKATFANVFISMVYLARLHEARDHSSVFPAHQGTSDSTCFFQSNEAGQRSRGHNSTVSSQPKGQAKANPEFEGMTVSAPSPLSWLLVYVLVHALSPQSSWPTGNAPVPCSGQNQILRPTLTDLLFPAS